MLSVLVASLLVASASALYQTDVCGTADSSFTDAQKQEIVDRHNELRSGEPSSDMLKMTWSDELEKRAQQWTEMCEWDHGITESCSGDSIGQNMYMNYGSNGYPAVSLSGAVDSWFSEKAFYHYDTQGCDEGEMCGHYTQVVWADSMELGCALVQCSPGLKVSWQSEPIANANLFVCDYSPAGNFVGEHIYEKGNSCSACASQVTHGWACENELCVPCTPNTHPGCQCVSRTCSNGGTWNAGECSCECPAGFYGLACENSCDCKDAQQACLTDAWKSFCPNPLYHTFMKNNCPLTCGLCDLPPSCNA